MQENILEYLRGQRVGVLAVEMLDGSPHASTLHFANSENPLVFYFKTSPTYRKVEPLMGREKSRASLVIGVDEKIMKTIQLDGEVSIITDQNKDSFDKVYFGKFPEKADKPNSPQVCFSFTPTWWRFTDWTAPKGKSIVLSTDPT